MSNKKYEYNIQWKMDVAYAEIHLKNLNEEINNCKEWNDYAIDLQNEYDHYLRRYNELLKEIGEI